MANLLTVGGVSLDTYGTFAINQLSPLVGGAFGGYNGSTAAYELGSNCIINTPNVSTIPNSILTQNNCNGETANCGVVLQDGGAFAGQQENGNCGGIASGTNLQPNSGYIGYLDEDGWEATYGNFNGDASTWGRPQGVSNGKIQTYPGNMSTTNDIYTITMLAGPAQGESTPADEGNRISYNASVGALAATLLKIQPALGAGFPIDRNAGGLNPSQNDEQAAAVWLAFGYGLFVGNGTDTIPAFWTRN